MRGVWFARLLVLALLSLSLYGATLPDAAPSADESVDDDSKTLFTPSDAAQESAEPLDDEDVESAPSENPDPLPYLLGGIGGLLLLAVSAIFVEYIGVIMLVALVVPMVSRRKKHKQDELNRGRILGYIEANAGIHFSALRDGLGLANGVTAYHTNALELEGKVFSWKSGKHRRYASSILDKTQRSNIRNPLSGTRLAILEVLAASGQLGVETKELRNRLQVSRQLLNHHIKELHERAMIEHAERSKRAWKASTYGQEQLQQSRSLQ